MEYFCRRASVSRPSGTGLSSPTHQSKIWRSFVHYQRGAWMCHLIWHLMGEWVENSWSTFVCLALTCTHFLITAQGSSLAGRESIVNDWCSTYHQFLCVLHFPQGSAGNANRQGLLCAWRSDLPSTHIEQEWKLWKENYPLPLCLTLSFLQNLVLLCTSGFLYLYLYPHVYFIFVYIIFLVSPIN